MDSLKRSTAALATMAAQMKRTLVTVLGSTTLLVAVSPTAKADAFLSLQNGAVTKSCDNSTAAGVAACLSGGFSTSLGSNSILFAGAVGGYSVGSFSMVGNPPGDPSISGVSEGGFGISNSTSDGALTVLFAMNNFALPLSSSLIATASQSATFMTAMAGSSQNFTAWANAANTLLAGPGNGTVVITPNCVAAVDAPPTQNCSQQSSPVLFTRTGNFALNGRQIISLNRGGFANELAGDIHVTPTPEPGSIVLVATGLFGLVGGRRVFRRKA